MKYAACILLLLISCCVKAQLRPLNYRTIDWEATRINANSVEALAVKLTSSYKTDLEKTRAIFSWIAQNISYNYKPSFARTGRTRPNIIHPVEEAEDTSSVLKPLNLIIAENVLKKRTAVCDGYARLFKTLCDYANIPCEIINGYARNDMGRVGRNFKCNHSWNAVKLNGKWELVDVTWASGYLLWSNDQFVSHYDDQYFLTPPAQFAIDHFPEDPQWSLLAEPPIMKEFQYSPFKGWSVVKYNITSYFPSNGIIQAAVGDTIQLKLELDEVKDKIIGGGYFTDSIALTLPGTVFLKPVDSLSKTTINYSFVVSSPQPQWLQLVYNDDLILRYKLNIRKQ